jgi:hypothetical protein
VLQWVGGSIFDCAQRSSYEAQVPFLGEITKWFAFNVRPT